MTTTKLKEKEAPKSELAVAQNTLPAALSEMDKMFMEDAGAGLEGADRDSFAIPFLSVLQKGSPQCDETAPEYIETARPGMIHESVSGTLYSGQNGVLIVPCAFRRVYLRWAPRDSGGGGYRGEYTVDEVEAMRARGEVRELERRLYAPLQDGSISEKLSDRFAETCNHYVLVVDDNGSWTQALLSLTSTQIKKSKLLNSLLASVKRRDAQGILRTPATYANLVRMTTVAEKNDKGSWHGVKFELAGPVTSPEIAMAAREFNRSVREGRAQEKYETMSPPDAVESQKAF